MSTHPCSSTGLRVPLALAILCALSATGAHAADADAGVETVRVFGQRVANLEPASSYPTLVTALRFDPGVEIQPRGVPEGQADIVVRGGLFENNAINIGPLSVRDPQTGHYLAELPLDPQMLALPQILTGVDSALAGINASVATLRYDIAPVRSGGAVAFGTGTDDLRTLEARLAESVTVAGGGELAAMASFADSRSDGSRPQGDNDFNRIAAQLQYRGDGHQTDLLVGVQDKFYGWPGAYTGFASLPETDDTRTRLVLADHRRELPGGGWWALGSYYRDLKNDYDFDRRTFETGVRGAFEHETRSYGLAVDGLVPAASLDWHWSVQLQGDELVESTDLVGGTFNERRYTRLALAPEKTWPMAAGAAIALKAGVVADYSDRDEDAVLPVARVSYARPSGARIDRLSLEYAGTSQVPGYTALKSPPTGLFGGNPDLGRERADSVALTLEREAPDWYARGSLFHRRHDDLVDWTYRAAAPFVRQANAVDMDVTGLELEAGYRGDVLELIGGYAWLDKNEDYGATEVDASYYALNYAEQRATLAVRYRPVPWLDVRLDNQVSRYRDNALRTSDADAYQAALSIGWIAPFDGLRVDLVIDNLADEDFQYFPGTPAPRRQVSLRTQYAW